MGQPLAPWLVLVFALEWLVVVMLGLVIAWLDTWLVTAGYPVDMAVSIVTVSSGLKELTRGSGRVWSESDCMNDMIIWSDWGNQDYHHAREDKISQMIEILYN